MTGRELMETVLLNQFGHAFIRCRERVWAEPNAYLRLSVTIEGVKRSLGPWAHLFSRETQHAIGEPTPQVFMTIPEWGPFKVDHFMNGEVDLYTGPLDPADQ